MQKKHVDRSKNSEDNDANNNDKRKQQWNKYNRKLVGRGDGDEAAPTRGFKRYGDAG